MSFRTSMHDYELDHLFRRFKEVIGESHWRQRVKKMNADIRGKKFLKHDILKENEIAYALDRCGELERQYGGLPLGRMDMTPVYPALAFPSHC